MIKKVFVGVVLAVSFLICGFFSCFNIEVGRVMNENYISFSGGHGWYFEEGNLKGKEDENVIVIFSKFYINDSQLIQIL